MPALTTIYRYKHDGELAEISNEFQYKKSKEELEDGIRLVLWAAKASLLFMYIL